MKHHFAILLLVVWTGLASAQTNTPATLSVDGKPVLQLSAPAGAKLSSPNGRLNIVAPNLQLYVWDVPGAKTVADALPRAAEVIKSEFIKFKPASTNDLQVAGMPAKDLTGPGAEADDEDPGNAEVVFFIVDGRVFVACVHGESDDAKPQHVPMLVVLKTAKAPAASP